MNKLFSDFPAIDTQEWEKVIEKDLKGQDYEKKLVWRTDEGLSIQPYYRKESLEEKRIPNPPGMPENWVVVEEISQPSAKSALDQFRNSLELGVDGFKIQSIWNGDQIYGVDLGSKDEILSFMKSLLAGVHDYWSKESKSPKPKLLHFYWDTSSSSPVYQEAWASAIENFSIPGLEIQADFFQDPLSALTVCGEFYLPQDRAFGNLKTGIEHAVKNLKGSRTISVNVLNFAHSGASLTQELGYALSMGSEYMSRLTEMGLAPEVVAKHILFRFAVGGNYFHEIAKLRAFRFLWNQVLSAYKIPESDRSCEIVTETSEWNATLFDPYVNLLRVTTESMSAVLGGTNSLLVHPFDRIFKESDSFSRRIARNVQHLLRHESYLDKVVDPSSGSYYIDSITHDFSEVAWKLFQSTDSSGGYIQSFVDGKIQENVKKVSEAKRKAILSKKEPILGTSQYPNPSEPVPSIQKQQPIRKSKPAFPDCMGKSDVQAEALIPWRAGEDFERLRSLQEEKSKKKGQKSQVLLFLTGHRAMRTARAGFATNFFGVAGLEIINPGPMENPAQEMESVLGNRNPDHLVFCSSDDEYMGICENYLPTLKKKFPSAKFYVAGNPSDPDKLRELGIDEFVHARSPLYETLEKIL